MGGTMKEQQLATNEAESQRVSDGVREQWRNTAWTARWGWNMFTMNMGTGAVAVCINSVPYKFKGQHALGTIFFILDIVLFIFNVTMFTMRAVRHPKIFLNSFYDQSEAVWLPTANLALATIIIGTISYGIPYCGSWLIVTCEVLYWVYAFLGAFTGLLLQNTFRRLPRALELVGPSDSLEVFPLMLCGTIGGLLIPDLVKVDPHRALLMLVFSYMMQGLGFFMGLLKLAVWMTHHITLARAPSKTIPAYVIAVGPPGFTALALINLGSAALDVFPANNFMSGSSTPPPTPYLVAQIFFFGGIWFAFMMVGMCTWILLVYVAWSLLSGVGELAQGRLFAKYEMSWWSWTFPLSGLISTLGKFATFMPSKACGVLNIIGTFAVFCMWAVNIVGTFTLLYHSQLPGSTNEYSHDALLKQMKGEETKETDSSETIIASHSAETGDLESGQFGQ